MFTAMLSSGRHPVSREESCFSLCDLSKISHMSVLDTIVKKKAERLTKLILVLNVISLITCLTYRWHGVF